MLALSIGIWIVLVFSFRVAFLGNPLYKHVTGEDPEFLDHIEQVTLHDRSGATEEELHFLQRFSRLTLMEFAVFLLEMGLLIYLFVAEILMWLSFTLILKNVFFVGITVVFAHRLTRNSVFASLVELPPWLIWLDRLSSLLSAIGTLVIFLELNNLTPWQ